MILSSTVTYGQINTYLPIPIGTGKPIASTVQYSTTNHGSSASISSTSTTNDTYTNPTSTQNCGIGNIGYSTGIHLFEVYYAAYTGGTSSIVGIGKTTTNFGSYLGADTTAYGWFAYGSVVYNNGSPITGTIGTYGVGHWVEIAVNFGALKMYGFNDGVPANGGAALCSIAAGTYYPGVGVSLDKWSNLNGNYATMAHPPSGYSTANNW